MIPRVPEPLISLRNSSSVNARRTRFFCPRSSTLPTNFSGLALMRPTRSIQLRNEIMPCRGVEKASPRLRLPLPDQDWQRLESVRALVYSPLAPVLEVVDFVRILNFLVKGRFPSPAPIYARFL